MCASQRMEKRHVIWKMQKHTWMNRKSVAWSKSGHCICSHSTYQSWNHIYRVHNTNIVISRGGRGTTGTYQSNSTSKAKIKQTKNKKNQIKNPCLSMRTGDILFGRTECLYETDQTQKCFVEIDNVHHMQSVACKVHYRWKLFVF